MISIGGIPKPYARRFTINLSQGSSPVFHLDARFNAGNDKNVLVRNTLQNGSWGTEERHVPYFPFFQNTFFEMIILAESECFKVAVNDQHFLSYNHRRQMSLIDRITVDGDITLTQEFEDTDDRKTGTFSLAAIRYPGGGDSSLWGVPIYSPVCLSEREKKFYQKAKAEHFHSLPVPFLQLLPGDLCPGKMIFIGGTPKPNAKRFTINLSQGSSPVFHFDARFNAGKDKNVLVRNTLQDGSWGPEERHVPCFPFFQNKFFEMIILAESEYFKIRYPGGGVSSPWGGAPIYNPPVPFLQHLPGGLYPGKMIFIGGVPKPNAKKFTINLSQGSSPVFHFDARFNACNDKNVLVRNTLQNGSWGTEERHVPYFPFFQNKFFEMIILADSECFKVALDNQHFLVYNHRIPMSLIDRITVNGDITLTQVRFQ